MRREPYLGQEKKNEKALIEKLERKQTKLLN